MKKNVNLRSAHQRDEEEEAQQRCHEKRLHNPEVVKIRDFHCIILTNDFRNTRFSTKRV